VLTILCLETSSTLHPIEPTNGRGGNSLIVPGSTPVLLALVLCSQRLSMFIPLVELISAPSVPCGGGGGSYSF
jgi:hypothetical protein